MRWDGNRESDNVEDDRDGGGGGVGGIRLGGGGIGLGSVVVALVAGWIFGINPLTILGLLSGGGVPVQQTAPQPAPGPRTAAHTPQDDRMKQFVSTVLADTEDVWTQVFKERGGTYRDPKLVLFRNATPTACGRGLAVGKSSASGISSSRVLQ